MMDKYINSINFYKEEISEEEKGALPTEGFVVGLGKVARHGIIFLERDTWVNIQRGWGSDVIVWGSKLFWNKECKCFN